MTTGVNKKKLDELYEAIDNFLKEDKEGASHVHMMGHRGVHGTRLGSRRQSHAAATVVASEIINCLIESCLTKSGKYRRHRIKAIDSSGDYSSSNEDKDETSSNSPSSSKLIKNELSEVLRPKGLYKRPLSDSIANLHCVPLSKEDWLDYLISLVKKKLKITKTDEKRFRHVVKLARSQVAKRIEEGKVDKDLPECWKWTKEEVAQWLISIGFKSLSDGFLANGISGRKLILMDASALNQMGVTNFTHIQTLTSKIRSLLSIPRPNALRPILRLPPFQLYLQSRAKSGKIADLASFKQFCKKQGFPYDFLMASGNKNGEIPCCCEMLIHRHDRTLPFEPSSSSSSTQSHASLLQAPSVEFYARHQVVRNEALDKLLSSLIAIGERRGKSIVLESEESLETRLRHKLLPIATGDLELYSKSRIEKGLSIGFQLLAQCQRTAQVISDIHSLQAQLSTDPHMKNNRDFIREGLDEFLEDVFNVGALLGQGELSLDEIFRKEQEFLDFVDNVVRDAEIKTNELIQPTLEWLTQILHEAEIKAEKLEEKDVTLVAELQLSLKREAQIRLSSRENSTTEDSAHKSSSI